MKIDLTNIHINLYRLVPMALMLWPAGKCDRRLCAVAIVLRE